MGFDVTFDRIASYQAENVIPAVRKISASSYASDLNRAIFFNGDRVSLHTASGGFNSVVQISASMALRTLFYYPLSPTVFDVSPQTLRDFLNQQEQPLESTALKELSIWDDFGYALKVEVVPSKLTFGDPTRVNIECLASITLLRERLERPNRQGSSGIAQGVAATSYVSHLADSLRLLTPVPIGSVQIVTSGAYYLRQDQSSKSAQVLANLTNAQVTFTPIGNDMARMWTTMMSDAEQQLLGQLTQRPQAHLTPRITLLGRMTGGFPLTEFPDFEARAFHVEGSGLQAMAVAFDVMPGCRGIIEEVEHFIGPFDFGVISDEAVIEQVFKYHWRIGQFKRNTFFQAPVTVRVQRDGREQDEDALLAGTYNLDTLDVVALDTLSDIRKDGIRIGGSGTVTPQSLTLSADGKVFKPGEVDLGPPGEKPWGVVLGPELSVKLDQDPQLRDFQISLTKHGMSQVALPFASSQAPLWGSIQYSRLEAITKRMFFLGSFEHAFD
jgi:hypothetical protein